MWIFSDPWWDKGPTLGGLRGTLGNLWEEDSLVMGLTTTTTTEL